MDLRNPAQLEIPIWVDGRQKWLTGLTKRTTCDDVIYALFSTEQRVDADNTHTYAIYERWRDVERPLQGRTKILKVWKAWSAEQKNVKLQLQRVEDLSYSVEWSRSRRRPRRSRSRSSSGRGSHCKCPQCGRKEQEPVKPSNPSSSTDSLVEVVESQEKQIRTLYRKIQDTDKKIGEYEMRMHDRRVKLNGQNYVQDAYLQSLHEDVSEELTNTVDPVLLDEYLKLCDKIIHLDDRIMEEREKIQILTVKLNQEMYNCQNTTGALSSHDHKTRNMLGSEPNKGLNPKDQLYNLQIEINKSTGLNLQQGIQLEKLVKELQLCNQEWQQKKALLSQLVSNLDNSPSQHTSAPITDIRGEMKIYPHHANSTQELYQCADSRGDTVNCKPHSMINEGATRSSSTSNCYPPPVDRMVYSDHTNAQNRTTSSMLKKDNVTVNCFPANTAYPTNKLSDNDSDTGLSSMHSDESPAILETLV